MTDIDTSAQLFSQAAVLLMVGMAIVFAFLSLLIIFIKIVISPLGLHFPDPITPVKNKPSQLPDVSNHDSSAIIAAIGIAIKKYRQKHK